MGRSHSIWCRWSQRNRCMLCVWRWRSSQRFDRGVLRAAVRHSVRCHRILQCPRPVHLRCRLGGSDLLRLSTRRLRCQRDLLQDHQCDRGFRASTGSIRDFEFILRGHQRESRTHLCVSDGLFCERQWLCTNLPAGVCERTLHSAGCVHVLARPRTGAAGVDRHQLYGMY